jgi:di/tricarboxylate transporter
MKKLIFVLLLTGFAFSVFAQSKSTMVFGEAIIKDKRMERIGTILTVAGSGTLFAGNILYWRMYNDNGNRESSGDTIAARTLMMGGLGLMAVGIPLWAIGKTKERHIKIEAELVKFKGLASVNGIGLKIRF